MIPQPGDAVRVLITKWGDRPHWEFRAVLLGSDKHGDWLGVPGGTQMSRPGSQYVAPVDQVVLVPAPGPDADRGWLATFHAAGGKVHTYVDMTAPPAWEGSVLHAVDLDLDVIRQLDGRVEVDDEDEFAEHRVVFDYPDEIVSLATSSCERILAALTDEAPPFDDSAGAWLAVLAARKAHH